MTEEDKQLLLIDLCARLPYGVICHIENDSDYEDILQPYDVKVSFGLLDRFRGHQFHLKPYLRPMSSMTTEEEYEYHQCKNINYIDICEMEHEEILETTALCFSHATDWLNKKGFDYRGLISMGLALEAKEGMYK